MYQRISLLAALMIAVVFSYSQWKKRIVEQNHITQPTGSVVNQQEPKSYSLSKLPQDRKSGIPNILTPINSPEQKDSKEASCWIKLKSELAFDHFYSYNKATLGRLIGEWYFSKNAAAVIEDGPICRR